MSIVTKLPNVSALSRAFISGRSKGTWHGDLYTQTGAGGNDEKKRGQGVRWLCVFLQNQCGFGLKCAVTFILIYFV